MEANFNVLDNFHPGSIRDDSSGVEINRSSGITIL